MDLVPIGIGEVIPEGITGEKLSCGGLGVSIPDGISETGIFVKTFPDFIPRSDQEILLRLGILNGII